MLTKRERICGDGSWFKMGLDVSALSHLQFNSEKKISMTNQNIFIFYYVEKIPSYLYQLSNFINTVSCRNIFLWRHLEAITMDVRRMKSMEWVKKFGQETVWVVGRTPISSLSFLKDWFSHSTWQCFKYPGVSSRRWMFGRGFILLIVAVFTHFWL